MDIVIGAEHEEVAKVTILCHKILEAHPRVKLQEATRDRDLKFLSPLAIGFSVTIDSKTVVETKGDSRGLFDFAMPRYNNWEILHSNKRGILIR